MEKFVNGGFQLMNSLEFFAAKIIQEDSLSINSTKLNNDFKYKP